MTTTSTSTTTTTTGPVFDYRLLRLALGLIAFALPLLVSLRAGEALTSISGSYYTAARDLFVGIMFGLATFLFAYNGHSRTESLVSNLACLAAIAAALLPTSCPGCAASLRSNIHLTAGAIVFIAMAYFCLGPFRQNTRGQTGKKGRRDKLYLACGVIILACTVVMGASKFILSDAASDALRITYWGEFIGLWAFGIGWMVAGKFFPLLVDEDEALKIKLFGKWSLFWN